MLERLKRSWSQCPVLFVFHGLLLAAVLALLLWKLLHGAWPHAGLCALTLLIFLIPSLTRKVLRLRLPPLLDGIIWLFAFAANLCGEMWEWYLRFPWWDSMLHLLWGFLGGLIGYAILCRWQGSPLKPPAAALCAFSFCAMTGVLWEFFEFFMDSVFHMDMQKDAWLHTVSSVLLEPNGRNRAATVAVEQVLVNGEVWPGLLDPGRLDTMNDLLLNTAGSIPAAGILLAQSGCRVCRWLLQQLLPKPYNKE